MDGTSLTLSEYAAMEELKHQHREGWGSAAALWVIAAIILVVAIVYNWTKNCNEKVAFATGLSTLNGKIECIAPQVATLNSQMYGAAQAFAGLTVGVNDIKENYSAKLDALNNTVFWNPVNQGTNAFINGGWFNRPCCNNNGCGCSPNRTFAATTTYAQTGTPQVTMTESCSNDRC